MGDIGLPENMNSNEQEPVNFSTARDETGAKLQILYNEGAVYGFSEHTSSSSFMNPGMERRNLQEFIPVIVDSRLKPGNMIRIDNKLNSSFYYLVTEKPKSAAPPKKDGSLLIIEDKYLKRLRPDEYQTMKDKEVPITQTESEIKMNNRVLKTLAVEIQKNV